MSFLFYLRWSLYHPIIISSFLFYLRWMLCHPVYSKYTLFFDKRQAKKKKCTRKKEEIIFLKTSPASCRGRFLRGLGAGIRAWSCSRAEIPG